MTATSSQKMARPVHNLTKIKATQASSSEELLASSIDQELDSSSHSTICPLEATTLGREDSLLAKALQTGASRVCLLEQPLRTISAARANLIQQAKALREVSEDLK